MSSRRPGSAPVNAGGLKPIGPLLGGMLRFDALLFKRARKPAPVGMVNEDVAMTPAANAEGEVKASSSTDPMSTDAEPVDEGEVEAYSNNNSMDTSPLQVATPTLHETRKNALKELNKLQAQKKRLADKISITGGWLDNKAELEALKNAAKGIITNFTNDPETNKPYIDKAKVNEKVSGPNTRVGKARTGDEVEAYNAYIKAVQMMKLYDNASVNLPQYNSLQGTLQGRIDTAQAAYDKANADLTAFTEHQAEDERKAKEAQHVKLRAANYFLNDPSISRSTGQPRRADRGGGQPYGVYKNPGSELGTQANFEAWYKERKYFNRDWYTELNNFTNTVKKASNDYLKGVSREHALEVLNDGTGAAVAEEEIVSKMIELSNAVSIPEWGRLESAYVMKFNRLLAVDQIRATMTQEEAFDTEMDDKRYELLFAPDTGRFNGAIDKLELAQLDSQRSRAENSINNLKRSGFKESAEPLVNAKLIRIAQMHGNRLILIEQLQAERRATLESKLQDRSKNADTTSEQKRKEQSTIRRERAKNKIELGRLQGMLHRTNDEPYRKKYEYEIAVIERTIEDLNEQEKTVAQEAKEAEATAKAVEREKRFRDSLKELETSLVDESVKVAAASLGLDSYKKALQKKFDDAARRVNGMPTTEDLEKINGLAGQPQYVRTRAEVGLDKRRHRSDTSAGSAAAAPETEELTKVWEEAATRMSEEQHDMMFLDEAEMKMQMADWESYSNSSTTTVPISTGITITSHNGYLRYNGHHFSEVDVKLGASVGADAQQSLADRAMNSAANPISIDELINAPVVVFNKPYARHFLTEHMLSLRRQQIKAVQTNMQAEFVNVAYSLGDFDETNDGMAKLRVIIDHLLPFFESMLKYYHTMIGVKRLITADALNAMSGLEALAANKTFSDKKARIDDIKRRLMQLGPVKDAYMLEARRLIASNEGRLPGQLYSPQPYILPLRIAAPPRVGKSAAALLAASLAKRIGMVALYSVAPNKSVPIAELQQKLKRLGWRNVNQDKDSASRWAVPASQGGVFDAQDQARRTFTATTIIKEIASVTMPYAAFAIDDVPNAKSCKEEAFRYLRSGKRYPTQLIDMIIYSAQAPEDVVRVGAILAKFARSDVVCFHIRDEAQVLAKAVKNPFVACHKVDVPPPLELQYLRAYMNNTYALNCLVTATHFPTLLEEKLYGYFGSVEQNLRAGMRADIGFSLIKSKPGAKFLPPLIPALRPYVSLVGYVGVNRLKQWVPKNNSASAESHVLEIHGANFRASRKSKAGGVLFTIDNYTPRQVLKPNASDAAAATPMGPRPTQDSLPAQKYGDDAAKKSDSEVAHNESKAISAAKLDTLSAYLGRNVPLRQSKRQAANRDKNAVDAEADTAQQLNRKRRMKSGETPTMTKKAFDTGSGEPVASGEQTRREADLDPDANISGSEGYSDDEDYEDKLDSDIAMRDLAKIKSHFLEWLDAPKQSTTPPTNAVDVAGKPRNEQSQILVPMYIGALNNNIADDGMISFVRSFGKEAHNRFLRGKAVIIPSNHTMPKKPPLADDDDQSKYGCAFILFTTALENRAAVDACNVHLQNEPDSRLPFLPKPPEPPRRSEGETGVLLPELYKPNELNFGERAKHNRAAIVFVYDPKNQQGIHGTAILVPQEDAPEQKTKYYFQTEAINEKDTDEMKVKKQPKLDCFFTSSASDAIKHLDDAYAGRIDKFAVLGYGMLTAGLTVQTYIPSSRKMFCPQYTALASTDQAALDSQLQIAGRSFVDLKQHAFPEDWFIHMLSVGGKIDKLKKYTQMEERFAEIGDNGELKPMYEVLKRGFKARFIDLDSFNTLGYLGVRRGEFSRILGLTPKAAQKLVKEVQEAKNGRTADEADNELAKKQLQDDETTTIAEVPAGAANVVPLPA